MNHLQVLREDHGGATSYDVSVSATSVPEPGTLAALGLGLARRKTKRKH